MFSSTKCCSTIVNYDFASIHFPSLILSLGTFRLYLVQILSCLIVNENGKEEENNLWQHCKIKVSQSLVWLSLYERRGGWILSQTLCRRILVSFQFSQILFRIAVNELIEKHDATSVRPPCKEAWNGKLINMRPKYEKVHNPIMLVLARSGQ